MEIKEKKKLKIEIEDLKFKKEAKWWALNNFISIFLGFIPCIIAIWAAFFVIYDSLNFRIIYSSIILSSLFILLLITALKINKKGREIDNINKEIIKKLNQKNEK
jgi:hypothetical protein